MVNAGPRDRPSLLEHGEAEAFVALHKVALNEARKVDLDVLTKVHPELPTQFRDKYLRYLELFDRYLGDNRHHADQLSAQKTFDEWADWYNVNRADMEMPKRRSGWKTESKTESRQSSFQPRAQPRADSLPSGVLSRGARE